MTTRTRGWTPTRRRTTRRSRPTRSPKRKSPKKKGRTTRRQTRTRHRTRSQKRSHPKKRRRTIAPLRPRTSTSTSTALRHEPSCFRPRAATMPTCRQSRASCSTGRQPRTGSGDEKNLIVFFDFAEREEKTVLDDADSFETTADGKKMLVESKKKFAILDIKAAQKFEKPLVTADMEAPVDPRAEWRQIFRDVYRFERDFFYHPNMHGVNWEALGERYSKVLEGAVTRWDVDFLIGEFIGELNASHT